MIDIVEPATRSRMMAGIRSHNTKPEIKVRKALHGLGFRFARTNSDLPGKPDIVLPRWKVAIFVHGCFWHWHECHLSKLPTSNEDFWLAKFSANRQRDARVVTELLLSGWRVLTIWECALRGKKAADLFDTTIIHIAHWIREESNQKTCVVPFVKWLDFQNDNKNS